LEVKFRVIHAVVTPRHFHFLKTMDTLYGMGQEGLKARKQEGGSRNEKEGEYHFREIQELEKPLVLVLEKLRARIEAGVYDVLLSDDVGGRIPTLALRKIMNKVNEKAGKGDVSVYFLSGNMTDRPSSSIGRAMREHIKEKIKNEIVTRALVVTEYVASGTTIQVLTDILEDAGVTAFDVVALVSNEENLELGTGHWFFSGITPENTEESGWPINAGGDGPRIPRIYGTKVSGVIKVDAAPHPVLGSSNRKRLEIDKAREDVETLAKNAAKALGW